VKAVFHAAMPIPPQVAAVIAAMARTAAIAAGAGQGPWCLAGARASIHNG
jgi:hypothetical protein